MVMMIATSMHHAIHDLHSDTFRVPMLTCCHLHVVTGTQHCISTVINFEDAKFCHNLLSNGVLVRTNRWAFCVELVRGWVLLQEREKRTKNKSVITQKN